MEKAKQVTVQGKHHLGAEIGSSKYHTEECQRQSQDLNARNPPISM